MRKNHVALAFPVSFSASFGVLARTQTAKSLARMIQTAKARLPADQRNQRSSFDCIVKVNAGHGDHKN